VLVVVPAEDGVVPADSVRGVAEQARAGGSPVEVWSIPHQGHTLVVPAVLPRVVDWLLQHPRRTAEDDGFF
jgi:hypothetical protein